MNESDREQLKNIKIRSVLSGIPNEINQQLSYSLIDILGAYLYDLRITNGEQNVESGWNIAKLAPTFAFLVRWDSPKSAIIGLIRRLLCYPLYRHWELVQKVLIDLRIVLKGGNKFTLKKKRTHSYSFFKS